jgi:hypothetical protein
MQQVLNGSIVMVQKIKLNGDFCSKSIQVHRDLEARNLLKQIHQILIADERDTTSIGYKLAAQYKINTAPFFIVTLENGSTQPYTAYQRFLKEIFHQGTCDREEVAEIIAQNPSLDFI